MKFDFDADFCLMLSPDHTIWSSSRHAASEIFVVCYDRRQISFPIKYPLMWYFKRKKPLAILNAILLHISQGNCLYVALVFSFKKLLKTIDDKLGHQTSASNPIPVCIKVTTINWQRPSMTREDIMLCLNSIRKCDAKYLPEERM